MDLKKIKAIMELVKESGVAELEIAEGEEKLRITNIDRNANYGMVGHLPPANYHIPTIPTTAHSTTLHQPISIEPATTNELSQQNSGNFITSPMVGTFYRSSSPTSNPFVEIGQEIKTGQVLCIIEAMKLMNQIEAESSGVIKEILVKDGSPVEYGQPLFSIN